MKSKMETKQTYIIWSLPNSKSYFTLNSFMCTFESLLYTLTATLSLCFCFFFFRHCLRQKCKIFGDGMVSHFVFISTNRICYSYLFVQHFNVYAPFQSFFFYFSMERLLKKIQFDSKLFCFQISSLMYFSLTFKGFAWVDRSSKKIECCISAIIFPLTVRCISRDAPAHTKLEIWMWLDLHIAAINAMMSWRHYGILLLLLSII